MRILVFSQGFYPHGGGAELATWQYSRLLDANGFETRIVTRQFPGEPSVQFVGKRTVIYRIPMRTVGTYDELQSRYDDLLNIGVLGTSFVNRLFSESDVVYLPSQWYSSIPLARIHRKPVVVHVHAYDLTCRLSQMYDLVEQGVRPASRKAFLIHEMIERRSPVTVAISSMVNELFSKYYIAAGLLADAFVFVSNAQMNLVLSRLPQIKNKGRVIYNPCPERALVETRHKGIGYFGGRNLAKGFNVFVRALQSLNPRGIVEAYMTMTSAQPMRKEFDNGVSINFLPKLKQDDFRKMMTKLSVGVVPSLWPETWGYALMDSILYGKLVIASNIGGMPEMVEGLRSGVRLVKPGDSEELADALDSFLAIDVEQAAEIGAHNRDFILKRFDNKRSVESLIRVFHEAMAKK
jgi:glycosyltransferase involved in cell wall biosynthesis